MKIYRFLWLLLLAVSSFAQTHTEVTIEDNQTITGVKTFTASNVFSGTTSFTNTALLTASGTWNDTQMFDWLGAKLNSCNPTTEFTATQGGHFAVDGVFGCATPPNGSIYQINAVAGYTRATDNVNPVAVYGQCIANQAALYPIASISRSGNVVTFNTTTVINAQTGTVVVLAGVTDNGTGTSFNGTFSLASGTLDTTGPFTFAQTGSNGTGTGGNASASPRCFAGNFLVQDNTSGMTAPLPFHEGVEIDANIKNASDTVYGLVLTGASTVTPATAPAVYVRPLGLPTNLPWVFGFQTADSAAQTGIQLGALSPAGASINGQPIKLIAYNSGSTSVSGSIQEDAFTEMNIVTNGAALPAGNAGAVLRVSNTSTSGTVSAYAAENDSTALNTTKAVAYDFWGRDSVSTLKQVGEIKLFPTSTGDFVGATMSLCNRASDALVCGFNLSGSGLVSTYNSIATAGNGLSSVQGATSQKAETTTADANVLTVTPPAAVGTYRACVSISVSAATAGVIGWTLSYTDSNGNAQANIAQSLFQNGTAAPALTFTTSVAGNYQSCSVIDINNAAANIIVKWVGGGTTTAKMSAAIERII